MIKNTNINSKFSYNVTISIFDLEQISFIFIDYILNI